MKKTLETLAQERILVLDGAMGTQIQTHRLSEEQYRGVRFKNWPHPLKGNNDLLCITQPAIIENIHLDYLVAGADILETNTFNSNSVSMADYHMQEFVYELNTEAVARARTAIEFFNKTDPRPCFIAGSIGPTNRTASLSPDVNKPGFRAIDFDTLKLCYFEQCMALLSAEVDCLLVETVFDTLNAKAALMAIREAFDQNHKEIPVMVSGTITDASGRTLSGQTVEAFLISMSHFPLFSIGFNCALGADQLLPYVQELKRKSPFKISAHPNAGLPNAFGEYDQGPEEMRKQLLPYLEMGLVNVLGGCCGTGPEHIRQIKSMIEEHSKHISTTISESKPHLP